MLTDDDLTRQLGGAFRESTDDLAYAGRVPAPRGVATTVGVPLASTAAVVAALAVVWASSPDTEDTSPPVAHPAVTTSPTPLAPAPELVTDTIEVAGFTFAYRHAADEPVANIIHAFVPDGVPDGARPVEVPAPAKAWVGKDPRSGEVAIYLRSPSRFDGKLFGVSSPGLDEDQMVTFLHTGDS